MKAVLITGACINTGVAIVEKFASEGYNVIFTGRSTERVHAKELEYRERIFAALKGRTLSMNELAKAMGYKGISAKLSSAIEKMLEIGALEKVVVGSYVKLHIPGDM